MDSLPIDGYLDEIEAQLDRHRAVVVVAEPGAGKTTRIPPALTKAGPVLLLQPRRAAARAIAHRIADERGWTLGTEIGWHVRLERRFSPATRLLVATEGILTARLQQDPLLSSFTTVILDEFHERSIHADLGLALSRQAWLARSDLRIVVMSATLDAQPVSHFLNDCPIVHVAGAQHPIAMTYAPGRDVAGVAPEVLARTSHDVLCFLPGRREIERAMSDIQRVVTDVDILPLHGSLSSAEQQRTLSGSSSLRRRIIVATNLAETSVTVPRVRVVVDGGLQKVARYDAARAIDSLFTERITADAADQRTGRAGRLGPGAAWRLWDSRDRLRPYREADIQRIDLSGALLEVAAWGEDPRRFEWFEAPPEDSVVAAFALLEQLGALRGGTITEIGRRLNRLPVHPRLARILLAGRGARPLCQACAMLSEQTFLPARSHATTSDLLSALDDWRAAPESMQQFARELERATEEAGLAGASGAPLSDAEFRRALLAGYPDRVGRRRRTGAPEFKLSTGSGALLSAESGVLDAEFLVALDVRVSDRDPSTARIRLASAIDADWLTPTSQEVVHRIDDQGVVRAAAIERYHALSIAETPVQPEPETAARLLAQAWLDSERSAADASWLRRTSFAGLSVDVEEIATRAAFGRVRLSDVRLIDAIPPDVQRAVDRDAPQRLTVPSGREVLLEYKDDGSVGASVKLQELFGLPETPRIGPRREPVVFSLLAPNGRPVQVTRDLRSFWDRTYPEVRKELRGRYPKHPWPEDPWKATPTARTTRRRQD